MESRAFAAITTYGYSPEVESRALIMQENSYTATCAQTTTTANITIIGRSSRSVWESGGLNRSVWVSSRSVWEYHSVWESNRIVRSKNLKGKLAGGDSRIPWEGLMGAWDRWDVSSKASRYLLPIGSLQPPSRSNSRTSHTRCR